MTPREAFIEAFEPAGGWADQADLDRAYAALSSTQRQVIQKLVETRADLVRLPGGFWTFDGCPVNAAGFPEWWVASGTVQAMDRKRLLIRRGVHAEAWRDHRALPAQPKAVR